jgi:hypothetical protein
MILEIIPEAGVGAAPIRINANQVVVRQNNGTVVAVAAEYGTDRCQLISHAGDDDFNDVLIKLGIKETTFCDTLVLPGPPSGARLISAGR